MVRRDRQRLVERARRDPQRKGQLDLVAGPEQHRHRERRARLAGRNIDDADLGMIGERGQGQQEALGLRQGGEGALAAGLHGLAGGREDRCGGKDDGTRRQRICQRGVADRRAAVDQEQVDRDDLRLELHDGVDDAGEIGARQRIAAAAFHDGVVDRDDGDEIGRNPHATDLRPPIRQRRLEAIEKAQMTVGVPGIDARAPQCGEHECHQDLNASATHVVVLQSFLSSKCCCPSPVDPAPYWPSLAINASTRGWPHVLTVNGPVASTSTPWPRPNTTPRPPLLRLTPTRPSATKTDVLASATSTAHFVPRTAAIACGVRTLKGLPPGFLGTSTSSALLLNSTESICPSRLASLSSNLAPLSATIVMPLSQRQVCVPAADGAVVQPTLAAGWAIACPINRNDPARAKNPARTNSLMPASVCVLGTVQGDLDTVPYHTQRLLKSAGCRSYFLAAAFSSAVRSTFGQGTGSRARSVMWLLITALRLRTRGGCAHQPRATFPRYLPGIEDHENDLVGWP